MFLLLLLLLELAALVLQVPGLVAVPAMFLASVATVGGLRLPWVEVVAVLSVALALGKVSADLSS